ncbi:MAG: hypothetical protein KDA89_09830, partial [Planctomycetaceae bacterium]|nr:hypothetical protein [Planctomycetaceae bacterium]
KELEQKVLAQERREAVVGLEKTEAEPEAEQPKRSSFFNLAGFLRGKSSDSEVAPDPFVDVESTVEKDIAAAKTAAKTAAENRVKAAADTAAAAASEKAEKFTNTLANVESKAQAEESRVLAAMEEATDKATAKSADELVDSSDEFPHPLISSRQTEASAAAADPSADSPADGETETLSFAEFAAQMEQSAAEPKKAGASVVQESSAAPGSTSETDTAKKKTALTVTTGAGTTASGLPAGSFEELLAGTGSSAKAPGKSAAESRSDFEKALDPTADDIFGAFTANTASTGSALNNRSVTTPTTAGSPGPQDSESPFFEPDHAAAPASVSREEDPFARAAALHGFDQTRSRNPWAQFDRMQEKSAVADESKDVHFGTNSPSESVGAAGFTWSGGPQSTAASPRPVDVTAAANDASAANPFRNSADENSVKPATSGADFGQFLTESGAEQPAAGETSHGLTIPVVGNAPAEVGKAGGTLLISQSQPEPLQGDPFLNATPTADDPAFAAAEAMADQLVAEWDDTAAAAASDNAVRSGWSVRTWILLLGCVVVALLLLMPERQKPVKS